MNKYLQLSTLAGALVILASGATSAHAIEYSHPGVYVVETADGVKAIPGVDVRTGPASVTARLPQRDLTAVRFARLPPAPQAHQNATTKCLRCLPAR